MFPIFRDFPDLESFTFQSECALPVDCEVDSKNCEDVVDNMEEKEMELRLVTTAAKDEEGKLADKEDDTPAPTDDKG